MIFCFASRVKEQFKLSVFQFKKYCTTLKLVNVFILTINFIPTGTVVTYSVNERNYFSMIVFYGRSFTVIKIEKWMSMFEIRILVYSVIPASWKNVFWNTRMPRCCTTHDCWNCCVYIKKNFNKRFKGVHD